ncbi:MAG: hypothetical protein FJY79_00870 [Candidatus Aminicenantes bacterium]|nr:hypothetical protein [Candidatus Aminicenantes bacterium]
MLPNVLSQLQQIGTGAAFIVFPLVFVFAFASHPRLLRPRLLRPEDIMLRARGRKLLQLGHALVLLNTALLVVAALHFMRILSAGRGAWAGFVGAIPAVLGAIILAADKGALCLTMSALDTVPDDEFSAMTPGLRAMFAKKGWMWLLWGIVLLPAGFAIQAVGLLQAQALPCWESILFLIGVLFVGTPDGLEIINLGASLLMAAAMIPYGIRLIAATF